MNGRIYDPLLGRFLSADLTVQSLGNLQAYNRYSYVMNNPLALVDPSGFIFGTPLSMREYFSAVGSGLGTGAANVGVAVVTAPVRFGTTVVSGYQQMGSLAGEALTGGLNNDVANMASNPLSTAKATAEVTGGAIVDTAQAIVDVHTSGDSKALANFYADAGFGIATGKLAVGELASTAAKTERVAATGSAEARVAAAAPETGAASAVSEQAPTAQFRGGPHGETKLPVGDGLESHHMPPDSVSPVSTNKGSAIQMDPPDHAATSSHGSQGAAGAEYRKQIGEMVNSGDPQKVRNAYAIEVKDVRRAAREVSGDATKYNRATQQMLEDAKKRKLLP